MGEKRGIKKEKEQREEEKEEKKEEEDRGVFSNWDQNAAASAPAPLPNPPLAHPMQN